MSVIKYFIEMLESQQPIVEINSEDKYAKQYDGKVEREIFDKAVALDPTSRGTNKVGQFVDWIIKHKAWDSQKLNGVLTQYAKKKHLLPPEYRDVNKVNPDQLIKAVSDAEASGGFKSKKDKAKERKAKAEKESEIVYNTPKYIVVVPQTQYASQYFGSGSDWCTARQEDGQCLFNDYHGRGTLYIVFDKETKDTWQLFVDNDGSDYEYKNNSNEDFDPEEDFTEDLIAWMEEKKLPKYMNREEEYDNKVEEILSDINYSVSIFDDKVREWLRDKTESDASQVDEAFPEILVREADKLFKILVNIGSNRDMVIDFSDEYMGEMENFIAQLDDYPVEEILYEYMVNSGPHQLTDYGMINRAVATGVIADVSEYLTQVIDDLGVEEASDYQKFFDAIYMYAKNGDASDDTKAEIMEILQELGYEKSSE